ncbi:hypothetical protein ES319_D05G099800v1 [Gossypium barbadense]|uniref:Malectin-like domain-containing protein n=1 Tax=Gossypium barbadense TaxID=3634 RepID=A0A5J5RAM3_GOSBA|nr:hypothetical protein ES319_D05G099800v1 [Gossypium barbadense]
MMIPSGSKAINATFGSLVETNVNYPPVMAVIEAVEALSPKQNLELSFTFSKTNRLDHFQLPIDGYTLPPLISAIEVYTASDPLVGVYTLKVDLNGLEVLISAFQQLQGWSREQCIPNDTVWQWLNCMGDNPPRHPIALICFTWFCRYLSGYDLDDPLPDFSQMDDALEAIDLRNNHLDGPIPVVLGKLLNLTLLIGSSKNQSESKRLALIIVLAKTSTQVQVTAVELGGVVYSAMSTDALIRPSLAIEYNNS